MKFSVSSITDLDAVCAAILPLAKKYSVFGFYGNLGAGKTTLIQQLCKQLGIQHSVTSPTYAIVHEYDLNSKPVYHIDLYRIKSTEEAIEAGILEYLDSGNICLVEWPDNFENLLPDNHVKIFMRKLENEKRDIEIIVSGLQ